MVVTLLPSFASAQAPTTDGIRVGENVALFHNDPRPTRARDSVGVAVNPSNPDHLVMVNADLYSFDCEFHTSFDGGTTWLHGKLRAPDGFGAPSGFPDSPCSSVGHGTSSSQGSVVFGSGDNVYVAFASARQSATGEPPNGLSALVARSTDGGKTFATADVALEGGVDRVNHYRFPSVVAIPQDGAPDRLVVAAWDHGSDPPQQDAAIAVSEDGGTTWSARRTANAETEAAREVSQIVAGPDGALYVAWRNYEFEGEVRVGRSTDGGVTWQSSHVDNVTGYRTPDRDFACCAYPRMAVDGTSGTVYVVWTEGTLPAEAGATGTQQFDHFIHPDGNVEIARSTDGGVSFSEPVTVNDNPPANDGNDVHQIRHAFVSVAPGGRVDVLWHDRRHWYQGCLHTHADCSEARLGDTYWAFSTDGGQSFSQDVRVTDRSMNNDIGSDYRLGVYWDFPPVAVPLGDDGIFVAWMDSRRGNWNTDALDIYYAKIALDTAATPLPLRHLPAAGTAALSATLGKYAYPGGSEATLVSTFATEAWTRVVIVNHEDPAAALVAGVLARFNLGPVLASPPGGLPAAVEAEVERMDPIGSFMIGDTAALGEQVVADLTALGVTDNVRIQGDTPAHIAAEVATLLDQRTPAERDELNVPAFTAAVIVNPDTAEGVAAASLAANRRLPVLFVGRDSVPAVTSDALGSLDIDATLVVGGTDSVSDAVLAELPNPKRLGGSDIYATSRAVATEATARGIPANIVHVADGGDPMGAALLGAAAGRTTGLLLLVPGADPAAATSALDTLGLTARVDRLVIPGGLATRVELSWACPDGTVPNAGFTDTSGNTHEDAIECAAWYALTEGGPAGRPASQFGPELSVRRDQMASFIARAIDHADPGLLPPASGDNPFPCDLDPANVHYDAIRRLAAAGIVQGGPDGTDATCYGPGKAVRRGQMASFIHRAVTLVGHVDLVTDRTFFTDVEGGHAPSINALASEGIVVGRSEGIYAPERSVRRDAMTSFLDRAMDFLIQHGDAQRPELVVR